MENIPQTLVTALITIIVSVFASSGFWAWMMNHKDRKNLSNDLLIGLAHNELVQMGLIYISRGWITQDEYENLTVYLYKPYLGLGGNGTVKRLMLEVDKLPIQKDKYLDAVTGDTLPPRKSSKNDNAQ